MSIFKRAIFIPQRTYRIGMAAIMIFILGLAVIWGERPVAQVASYAVANRVIVIDPGHGGFDPGAQRGEFKEKEITLNNAGLVAGETTHLPVCRQPLRDR